MAGKPLGHDLFLFEHGSFLRDHCSILLDTWSIYLLLWYSISWPHIFFEKKKMNPKSTSNQSSKPCTVLQYPSKKVWYSISWPHIPQYIAHTATHRLIKHTATHCNTLQHTATHRNTPQHTATHCNTWLMYIFHGHVYMSHGHTKTRRVLSFSRQ